MTRAARQDVKARHHATSSVTMNRLPPWLTEPREPYASEKPRQLGRQEQSDYSYYGPQDAVFAYEAAARPCESSGQVDILQMLHDGARARQYTMEPRCGDFGLPAASQNRFPLELSRELEVHPYAHGNDGYSSSYSHDYSSSPPAGGPPGNFFANAPSPPAADAGLCILSTKPLRTSSRGVVPPAPLPAGPLNSTSDAMKFECVELAQHVQEEEEEDFNNKHDAVDDVSSQLLVEEETLTKKNMKNTFIHFKEQEEDFVIPLRQVRSCPGSRLPSPRGSGEAGAVDKSLVESLTSPARNASKDESDSSSTAAVSSASSASSESFGPPPLSLSGAQDAAAQSMSLDLLGSPALPSVGSMNHHRGLCKPCAFVARDDKLCMSGVKCNFCHLCSPGEKQRRKKEKMALIKARRLLGSS